MTILPLRQPAPWVWPALSARISPRAALYCLAACLVLAAAAVMAHERLFSTFLEYDDEGYVLLTLQSFAAGHPLYDDTYTQYGPAFYLLESVLRGVTRLPLTHDATRMKTLAFWLLAAALSGAIVYRFTRRPAWAFVGFAAALLHSEKLVLEPGHPQEWCLLGVLAAIFAATLQLPGQARCRLAVLAVATALVAGIKLNLGVFLGLGIAIAMACEGGAGRRAEWLKWLLVAAACALPLVLVRQRLDEFAAWRLPAVVAGGLIGVVFLLKPSACSAGPRPLAIFVAGAAALVAAICGWCLVSGTSFGGLAQGLVLQHGRFTERFYHPLPVPAWTPLWCVVACGLAFAARAGSCRALRWAQVAAIGLAVYLGVAHVAESFTALEHGLVDRGGARLLLAIFAPLAWLVVRPGRAGQGDTTEFPARAMLAFIAVLQPLATYPTPGTQLAVGTLPLLLCLLVAVDDLMGEASAADALPSLGRWAAAALGVLLIGAVIARDVTLTRQRAGYVALDLPGARRLKLPAAEARRWQWAAERIARHGQTFVGLHHAQSSLYFWTGQRPPTPIVATFWSHLLDASQQQRIIDALERQSESCVFNNRESTSRYDPDSPLVRYLLAHYEPAESLGDFEIWRRRSAAAAD